MILIEPEQGIADQEVLNLIATVIKNECIPVRLFPLLWICVFVEVRSIKIAESCFILWKMRRDPIQNHADALLMKVVDEIHEIGRRTKPAGRSKVTDDLVSPGTIERMFHDREKFDVRKTSVMDIIGQAGEPSRGRLASGYPHRERASRSPR